MSGTCVYKIWMRKMMHIRVVPQIEVLLQENNPRYVPIGDDAILWFDMLNDDDEPPFYNLVLFVRGGSEAARMVWEWEPA